MTVGDVLSEAFALYRRFFWRFVGTAAAVFVVLDLLVAIANSVRGESALAFLFWAAVSLVVTFVGSFWLQGALVECVADVRDGRIDTTISELFRRTRPRLPALISAGVLAGIGIVVGLVLLIVPGLYLLTRWALITPAIVLEGRRAGDSFGRSSALVRGHGWTVFGVIFIALLGTAIVESVLNAIFAFLPSFLQAWLGGLIADSVAAPFLALAATVIYFRLARSEPAPAQAA